METLVPNLCNTGWWLVKRKIWPDGFFFFGWVGIKKKKFASESTFVALRIFKWLCNQSIKTQHRNSASYEGPVQTFPWLEQTSKPTQKCDKLYPMPTEGDTYGLCLLSLGKIFRWKATLSLKCTQGLEAHRPADLSHGPPRHKSTYTNFK